MEDFRNIVVLRWSYLVQYSNKGIGPGKWEVIFHIIKKKKLLPYPIMVSQNRIGGQHGKGYYRTQVLGEAGNQVDEVIFVGGKQRKEAGTQDNFSRI
ncbi:hypothetical protein NXY05_20860, partial [Bacteroides fragilis]|nr:hypothetical protein [Bacteroides fragilis]